MMAAHDEEAWELLQQEPDRFDAVLLDRMMPRMNGMELLALIKGRADLSTLPTIMQTAMVAEKDILEGLQAGAYYYLTKPVERDPLLAIVAAAVDDYQRYRLLWDELQRTARTLALMASGRFLFRTIDECKNLAALLASMSPRPDRVVVGLSELLMNAVEHGNLGISYDDKSKLNETGS